MPILLEQSCRPRPIPTPLNRPTESSILQKRSPRTASLSRSLPRSSPRQLGLPSSPHSAPVSKYLVRRAQGFSLHDCLMGPGVLLRAFSCTLSAAAFRSASIFTTVSVSSTTGRPSPHLPTLASVWAAT